jgi:hypothetical protein
MAKRLLKVVSVPIAIFLLMIPMIIIQSVRWVITGSKTPMQVIEQYMEWLDNG